MQTKIIHCDVLPCLLISDHDVLYACVNSYVTRFVPGPKYIHNKRVFDEKDFLGDF